MNLKMTSSSKARNIRDIARAAGVSTATVSRVLRGDGPVATATRDSVLRTVKDMDFRPSPIARSLRSGKSSTIALAIGDIEQGWYSALTRKLQMALEDNGLDVLLFNLGHDSNRLERLLERAELMRLQGVAIASTDSAVSPNFDVIVEGLKVARIPILSLAQPLDRHGAYSIVHDDSTAAETAVRYLVEKGRRLIAYLGRITDSATGTERYNGYRHGLRNAGLQASERLIWDRSVPRKYRYAAGYHAVASALGEGVEIDGLIAGSDELALGAMAAAQDHGVKVPDSLAIIGFGGLEWGRYTRPSLTTMDNDLDMLANKACEFFTAEDTSAFPLLTRISRPLRPGDSA